jgi:hypothetical protein
MMEVLLSVMVAGIPQQWNGGDTGALTTTLTNCSGTADMAVQGAVAAVLVAYVVPPCAVLHAQYVVGVTVTLAARKSDASAFAAAVIPAVLPARTELGIPYRAPA